MYDIIRVIQPEQPGTLPEEAGLVEDIDVDLEDDGYEVQIRRTLWTRNKRRAVSDQRGNPIRTDVLVSFTAHEAATLVASLASTLVHAENSFVRPPSKAEQEEARGHNDAKDLWTHCEGVDRLGDYLRTVRDYRTSGYWLAIASQHYRRAFDAEVKRIGDDYGPERG